LELNGTHQHIVSYDDVNILGANITTIRTDAGSLSKARREADLK
jgi:hypothetical protein